MNHTPVKILLAITKSNWGGAQRYVYDVAIHFNKDPNFEVQVLAGGDGVLLENLKKEHVVTHSISSLKRDVGIVADVISTFEIYTFLKKERPDILHLNSSKMGLLGAIAGRLAGVKKIIFTSHAWPFNETRPYYQKVIFRILGMLTVLLSHKTIAVSQSVIRSLHAPSYITKKMTCIYTGIDTPKLFPRGVFFEERNLERKEGLHIVSIGELHMSKGFDRALIALAQCKHLSWTYHIMGTGEKETYLKNLAHKLGIGDRVFFHGFTKNASLYLDSFDLFLFPSRTEALGYVAIEALFSHIPIIASNAGGIPEVLFDDPYTKLIDCNNEKIFRETLISALKKKIDGVDPTKRPGTLRFLPRFMYTATKKLYLN
jgi:glycosyltransferase involved in cell wall biosynthesis